MGLWDPPDSLLKSLPEQVLEFVMIVVIVPSLRIHIAKHVLESPQRNAEWKDPSLSPVDYPCYMSGIGIHKYIHLAEIVMT